jgi:hypothetical protein
MLRTVTKPSGCCIDFRVANVAETQGFQAAMQTGFLHRVELAGLPIGGGAHAHEGSGQTVAAER